jgi:hypothetical protein
MERSAFRVVAVGCVALATTALATAPRAAAAQAMAGNPCGGSASNTAPSTAPDATPESAATSSSGAPPAGAATTRAVSQATPASAPAREELRFLTLPTARFGLGVGGHVAGTNSGAGIALDATAGVHWMGEGQGARPGFTVDLGYSYVSNPAGDEHFFNPGVGAVVQHETVAVGLTARLLLGTLGPQGAWGVRGSIPLMLFYGLVGAEVGYQYVSSGSAAVHDIVALLWIDLGLPLGFLLLAHH